MHVDNWVEPPCRHLEYMDGCMWCHQWLYSTPVLRQKLADFYRQKYPKWAYKTTTTKSVEENKQIILKSLRVNRDTTATPIIRQSVTIPAKAERLSLPVRSPCKYEGAVILACRACNANYKVRHCEHPDADWDFCARAATPIKDGQNCQTCPIYQPQGT